MFEDDMSVIRWELGNMAGTGGVLALDASFPCMLGKNAKSLCGYTAATATYDVMFYKRIGKPSTGKAGFECLFGYLGNNTTQEIILGFTILGEDHAFDFYCDIDLNGNTVKIWSGSIQILLDSVHLSPYTLNYFKMVIDTVNNKYISLIINHKSYNVTGIIGGIDGETTSPNWIEAVVRVKTIQDAVAMLFWTDAIITEE
jgi:hypothetical protein